MRGRVFVSPLVWLLLPMIIGTALAGRAVLSSEVPAWALLGFAVVALLGGVVVKSFLRAGVAGGIRVVWPALLAAAIWSVTVIADGRSLAGPWWTGAAFAALLWAWTRTVLASRGSGEWISWVRRTAFFSGIVIVYQVSSDPLYDFPLVLTRSVGFGVFLCAVGLWMVREKEARGDEFDGDPEATAPSLLGPSLALAGLVSAVLWSTVLDPVDAAASRVRLHFREATEVTELSEFGADQTSQAGGSSATGEGGRSLPRRADIKLGNALRAVIEINDAEQFQRLLEEPIYLRSFTLSVIEGDGEFTPLRQGEWIYDDLDGKSDGRITRREKQGGVLHTVYVDGQQISALPMLTGMHRIHLSGIYEYADDWYQLALGEGQDLIAFRAVSDFENSVLKEDDGGADDLRFVSSAMSDYLQLPSSRLMRRLGATASTLPLAVGARDGPVSEQLELVRQFLDERCEYSLEYENPENLPAVENFLFGERRGHCELFAASTVMLLRSLGIPSRVAYGYSGGTARTADRTLAFRDRDFHAWAEVLVAGRGWMIFDTTPSGAGANAAARTGGDRKGAGGEALPDLSAYELLEGVASGEYDQLQSWMPDWLRKVLDYCSFYLTEIFLLAIALIMAVWLSRIGRLRRRKAMATAGAGSDGRRTGVESAATVSLAEKFFALWEGVGIRRAPGQTLREFVDRLRAEGLCRNEFDEWLAYLYSVRYSGAARCTETEQRLQSVLSRFGERLAERQESSAQ